MNYRIKKILENYFQNMTCFSWIKLISVLICLKYWYYNTLFLELPCFPCPFCQISPWPAEIPSSSVFLFCPILCHHAQQKINWIYQTKCQAKSIRFIIKLYTNKYLFGETRYVSKISVFKTCFSFKVRQHGQQQLYIQ